eukprot:2355974-Rhodomonas_salina.5
MLPGLRFRLIPQHQRPLKLIHNLDQPLQQLVVFNLRCSEDSGRQIIYTHARSASVLAAGLDHSVQKVAHPFSDACRRQAASGFLLLLLLALALQALLSLGHSLQLGLVQTAFQRPHLRFSLLPIQRLWTSIARSESS